MFSFCKISEGNNEMVCRRTCNGMVIISVNIVFNNILD